MIVIEVSWLTECVSPSEISIREEELVMLLVFLLVRFIQITQKMKIAETMIRQPMIRPIRLAFDRPPLPLSAES